MLKGLFSRGKRKESAPEGQAAATGILIFDDNVKHRQLIKSYVDTFGFSGLAVDHIDAGVDFAQTGNYGAAVICCRPGGIDGAELAVRIEAVGRGYGLKIPVIGLVSGADKALIQRYRGAGMKDVIPMPVHAEDLARVLRQLMPAQESKRFFATTVDAAIDENTLLKWVDGDMEILAGVIPRFISDLDRSLEHVRDGLAQQSGDKVAFGSQALRSMAATIGAHPLEHATHQLNEVLLTGDMTKAAPHWENLAQVVAACQDALASVLERHRPRR